jgi:predicted ATPase/DNA-binding XRE family transcriptional regulator
MVEARMTVETIRPFSEVLKESRVLAGLTQEALAERSGLSVEAIRALERGRRGAPRFDTVTRLSNALGGDDFSRLVAAARSTPVPDVTPPVARHLPSIPDSFIGREREQARVAALLDDSRLVTLVGAGGIGKSRLALAVAEAIAANYPDGAWLVELAALSNPILVPDAVATALGLRPEANQPLVVTLVNHLATRRLLLILDNCEHLVSACADLVGTLLRSCPAVHILATSREALRVIGERRFGIPALTTPPTQHRDVVELARSYDAVRLFVARAQERVHDFELDAENVAAVAEICARLDGIPLALELAASRVGMLPVQWIAERLDDRFRLLSSGDRTALPRQRTLRAALDWSWDLLEPVEQRVLARLAVFAGGCTLAAAQSICIEPTLDEWSVLDILDALADKSLLSMDEHADETGNTRYRMLETVRQYARDRLAEHAETASIRDRHLQWYAALVDEADRMLLGPEQTKWLARLESELDNLRSALNWSVNTQAGETPCDRLIGVRLAATLSRFWRMRSLLNEGRYWLTLARDQHNLPPDVKAAVLYGIGFLSYYQGDYASAIEHARESLALFRDLRQDAGIANAQMILGLIAEMRDEYALARTLVEECLALFRELQDMRGVSTALYMLGQVARDQGHYDQAGVHFAESYALCRSLGDSWAMLVALNRNTVAKIEQGELDQATALATESLALSRELHKDTWSVAWALCNLSQVAIYQGNFERAAVLAEESQTLSRQIGAQWSAAIATSTLGLLAHEQGDFDSALRLYRECLTFHRAAPNKWRVAECLEAIARALVYRGAHGSASDLDMAAHLFGAAEALRAAIGAPRPPVAEPAYRQAVESLREALGIEATAESWAAGALLTWQEAADQAMLVPD